MKSTLLLVSFTSTKLNYNILIRVYCKQQLIFILRVSSVSWRAHFPSSSHTLLYLCIGFTADSLLLYQRRSYDMIFSVSQNGFSQGPRRIKHTPDSDTFHVMTLL